MKIIVYHSLYGCDTGCCGHRIEIDGERTGRFVFGHPYSDNEADRKRFAEQLVREEFGEEHVKDLDWENCMVIDDW